MRGDGDEVRSQRIQLHRPLVQSRTLDCNREPVGDELQQIDVLAGEPTADERADVDHADRLAGDEQRHAEHRLDSLLAQDRVEHVGVLDVGEDHRLALGRDPAGEPRPTGMRTPRSTSSSIPTAARATSSFASSSSRSTAHVSAWRMSRMRGSSTANSSVELEVGERRVRDRLHILDLLSRPALRLERPCMLDRDRRAVAGELQQVDVVVVERPEDQRPDVEDADQAPPTSSGTPSIDLIPFSRRIGLSTSA